MEDSFTPVAVRTMVTSLEGNSEELEQEPEFIPAGDFGAVFTRGVPLGASQLWYGGPGTGKSRLAMRFATHLGRTLVCALEMGEEMTAQLARESGSKMVNYWTCRDTKSLWHDLPFVEPLVVIVDSIQELGRGAKGTIKRLYDWANETGGIAIHVCQVNSKGTARGGPSHAHKVDIELQLVREREGYARFVTRKNRFSLPNGEPVFFLGKEQTKPAAGVPRHSRKVIAART
jgi:predicted ATP-dependent serine protease